MARGRGSKALHVVVLVGTLAAFAFSTAMIAQRVGLRSPWLVLMLFLCFLGTVKIAEPVYMLRMPAAARAIRPWELDGKAYRALGVPQFGALLRNTPLRILNLDVYVAKQRRDLPHLMRLLESAEASHFWAFILLAPYVAWCAATGRWEPFGWFLFAEIFANAYPAMHLRMVRARLERVQRRR